LKDEPRRIRKSYRVPDPPIFFFFHLWATPFQDAFLEIIFEQHRRVARAIHFSDRSKAMTQK
jgi:hypothetical protein